MDSKKRLGKIIAFYFTIFAIFTILFFCYFYSPLFSSQWVLFYRGIELLLITIFSTLLVGIIINNHWFRLTQESLIAALIVSLSIHVSFFVIFPVTFDRSVTMYLLSRLNTNSVTQSCNGLSENNLEQSFINEYVIQQGAVNRRIKEQLIIKMLEENNSCVQLTAQGKNFLKLSAIIKKVYKIK
ncbi:MAG: hypothetical protein HY226_03135 [Candidatus Vogelbacteria bacterium]|nr:hypothetical protein [Candidatus Vogelbacteria bacterium]